MEVHAFYGIVLKEGYGGTMRIGGEFTSGIG